MAETLMLVVGVVAALLCGPLDRLRGHERHILGQRALDKLAYGAALALALGVRDPLTGVVLAGLLVWSMSPGWGDSMGAIVERRPMDPARREWWMVGRARTDPHLALVCRGVVWGLAGVPVAIWQGDARYLALIPIYALAMPAAMVARRWAWWRFERDAYGRCEWLRGWLAGFAALAVGLVAGG